TLLRPLLQRHALGRVVLWVEVGEVVDIGPAILLALLDEVELFLLLLVAQPVGAVIGAVETAAGRLPAEADGVPQAAGKDGSPCAVEIGADDGGVLGIGLGAGVAGGTDGYVELAVRADGKSAIGVLPAIGQVVDDHGQIAEAAVFGDGGRVDLVDGDEVSSVLVEGEAVHAGTGCHDREVFIFAVAIVVLEPDDVGLGAAGGVEVPA